MSGTWQGGRRYRVELSPWPTSQAWSPASAPPPSPGPRPTPHCSKATVAGRPYNWFNFFDFWRALAPIDRPMNSRQLLALAS
jgi:hypothetical protein